MVASSVVMMVVAMAGRWVVEKVPLLVVWWAVARVVLGYLPNTKYGKK